MTIVRDFNPHAQKAEVLRALHRPGNPVLFFNVWDAVSARILEDLGYPAVATSSAAIAWSEGFADGERVTRERMLEGVKRVTAAVRVPVTADLENAYGTRIDDAADTARGAIEAGAVGLNFEDGGERGYVADLEPHCRRIAAMVATGREAGVPLVINARTDVFLDRIGPDDRWRFDEAVKRGNAFLEAGAACVFVPGVTDAPTIERLVKAIGGPVNVLATAASPAVSQLAELGVARVSCGGAPMAHALKYFRDAAVRLQRQGTFEYAGDRIAHAELNQLFSAAE
jgi:2-methylisocitrate lyase-like PEP mutase family enzyme